jgi:hypothetical protein
LTTYGSSFSINAYISKNKIKTEKRNSRRSNTSRDAPVGGRCKWNCVELALEFPAERLVSLDGFDRYIEDMH